MPTRFISLFSFVFLGLISQSAWAHPSSLPHVFHSVSEFAVVVFALAVVVLGCVIFLLGKLILADE